MDTAYGGQSSEETGYLSSNHSTSSTADMKQLEIDNDNLKVSFTREVEFVTVCSFIAKRLTM